MTCIEIIEHIQFIQKVRTVLLNNCVERILQAKYSRVKKEKLKLGLVNCSSGKPKLKQNDRHQQQQ